MKRKFAKIAIAFSMSVLILGLSACSDFLDTAPTYDIASENVWANSTLATAAVLGAYNTLYTHFSNMYASDSQGRGSTYEAWSSAMDACSNYRSRIFPTSGSLTPSTSQVEYQMSMWYEMVYAVNDVINNIDDVPDMSDELKSQYKSECKFLRAYAYSLMNIFWGGVPLYLENVDDSEATLARSTTEEVWAQVISDLTDCIEDENLPDKYDAGDSDYGRITKGAAYAFRGQAYQFLEDWSSALADFEAVEDCGYELYSPSDGAEGNDDFFQLFKEANEQCDEMIFSVQCVETTNCCSPRAKSYGSRCTGGSGWDNYHPSLYYVELFENADGSEFDWDDYIPGYTDMDPIERSVFFLRDGLESGEGEFGTYDHTTYYDKMEEYGSDMSQYLDQGNEERIKAAYENRDPRLMMSVITPYSDYDGYVSSMGNHTFYMRFPYIINTADPYDIRSDTSAYFYYLWRKAVPENDEATTAWISPIDIPLCRYAEVLLRRAECLNELGRTDEAVTYVNMVRKRAGHVLLNDSDYPATIVDGQDDMRERIRKEFYYEVGGEDSMYQNELRWGTWYDLKFRKHVAGEVGEVSSNGLMQMWGENTNYYVSVGEHCVLWPIPASEIEKNPNLTQNTGYSN